MRWMLLATLFGMASLPAEAATIYTYTGNPFTRFSDRPEVPGSYTTDHFVSGSVVLPSALPPDSAYIDWPLRSAFSLSDGRRTISHLNGEAVLSLWTGAAGEIIGWIFGAFTADETSTILSISDPETGDHEDQGQLRSGLGSPPEYGRDSLTPGTWTISTVPEPALSGLVLAMVGAALRRRRA